MSGPRLGRGLAALLGEPPAPAQAERGRPPADPRRIPQPRTHFSPAGPIDEASLAELVESVRARGILQPLLARPDPASPGRYQIIAGERRWRAAQAAGLHEVPVLVRDAFRPDAMAAALVENLQRQDLNAIEEAEGYRRLLDEFGLTQEQLGEAVGKSRSHVANTLRLLNLPAVRPGRSPQGRAHRRPCPRPARPSRTRWQAALSVIARGLNVRQTEALTHGQTVLLDSQAALPTKDPETAALEADLSERLGLKVEIAFDGKRGSVRIHYRSLDQLDGIVSLLNR